MATKPVYVSDFRDYDPQTEKPIPGSLRFLVDAGVKDVRIGEDVTIHLKQQLAVFGERQEISGPATLTGNQVTAYGDSVTVRNLRIRAGEGYATDEDRRKIHGQYDDPASPSFGGIRSYCSIKGIDHWVLNCSIGASTDDNLSFHDAGSGARVRHVLVGPGTFWDPAHNYEKGTVVSKNLPTDKYLRVVDAGTFYRCVWADLMGRLPDLAGGLWTVEECISARHRWQGSRLTQALVRYLDNHFYEPKQFEMATPDQSICFTPADNPAARSVWMSNNTLNGAPAGVKELLGYINEYKAPLRNNEARDEDFFRLSWGSTRVRAETILNGVGCKPWDAHDMRTINSVRKTIKQGYVG